MVWQNSAIVFLTHDPTLHRKYKPGKGGGSGSNLGSARPAHHGKKLLPPYERLYSTAMGRHVMGSQLTSNAVRSFFLAMVLTALLTGSVAEAAS